MIEKVPGFLIVTGTNGGERGLGQATENILIDGERIANKATDARTALSRIAANGNKWNINLGGQLPNLDERVDSVSTRPGARVVREHFSFREREHNFNIGGDYETALAGGRLKMIARHRFEHSPIIDMFIVDR